MIIPSVSRRDFLRLAALSLGGLAAQFLDPWLSPDSAIKPAFLGSNGRVTRRYVYVYLQPDEQSRRQEKLERDTLVEIKEELIASAGPTHNPRWYRLQSGYVHSAYIQRISDAYLNLPLAQVPETGLLGEITVPYSQSYYTNRKGEWLPLYRLYYSSLHWITGVWIDVSGQAWYQLTDEWLKIAYHVPAVHVHPVTEEKWAPISPELPDEAKRIELSLVDQTLVAYEDNRIVFSTKVATGKRYMETPKGEFQINRKMPSKHMGNGALTSDLGAFELPGVPWVCFFHTNGVSFHGTYWHDNFGTPMSQGCVNMRTWDALWLFRWCTPV
jgi:hypothetical protein